MFRQSVIKYLGTKCRPTRWTPTRMVSSNAGESSDRSTTTQRDQPKMSGWQIHEYGDVDILQFNNNIKMPMVKSPNEVLVKVSATSVNPIDVAMMSKQVKYWLNVFTWWLYAILEGYGSTLLNAFRCSGDIEFPLTLGRDFCGVVTRKGMNVRNNVQIGDVVWGMAPLHRNGCHAEYIAVDANCVSSACMRTVWMFDAYRFVHIIHSSRTNPAIWMPSKQLVLCMPASRPGQAFSYPAA